MPAVHRQSLSLRLNPQILHAAFAASLTCEVLMMPDDIESVPPIHNTLGESPLWHPVERALYWVEFPRSQILRFWPTAGQRVSSVPEFLSGGIHISSIQRIAHSLSPTLCRASGPTICDASVRHLPQSPAR